jgi:Fic family protein
MVFDMSELKQRLTEERDGQMAGGLYYWTQVLFAFNSNHIEGTQLSESQTQQIFDTGTFFPEADEPVKADDVIETQNHFRAFDYILENADEPLTHEFLQTLHAILKHGTSQEFVDRYNVGGYKTYNNQIGSFNALETVRVEDVKTALDDLFSEAEALIDDEKVIAKFHHDFEAIHPFSDGNGRIGRLILFKELLRIGGMPLIVRDENRAYYIRGLREFATTPDYLTDTLGAEQDYFKTLIQRFD